MGQPSLNATEKYCPCCEQILPVECFYKLTKAKRIRFSGYCKDCNKQKAKTKPKEEHRKTGLKQYGLTLEDYNKMLVAQDGKCAICGSTEPYGNGDNFCVDHNHKTGQTRGLLCQKCNQSLGLMKESQEYLNKAAEYLDGWGLKA